MQQIRRKERGFTIIELVVVILLLGILAAVALPRFINVTDEAHTSAVQGVYGGFSTGIAMYRAQYTAEGQPSTVEIDGYTLPMGTNGYPLIADATACVQIWESALQSGRPVISAATPVATAGDGVVAADLATAGALDPMPDFAPFYDEGTGAEPVASCFYVYTAQYGEDTGSAPGAVSVIQLSESGLLDLIRL